MELTKAYSSVRFLSTDETQNRDVQSRDRFPRYSKCVRTSHLVLGRRSLFRWVVLNWAVGGFQGNNSLAQDIYILHQFRSTIDGRPLTVGSFILK